MKVNPEWYLFAFLVVILGITACRSELGERINCNIIHVKAKQQGKYCYTYGDTRFCTEVDRPKILPMPEK